MSRTLALAVVVFTRLAPPAIAHEDCFARAALKRLFEFKTDWLSGPQHFPIWVMSQVVVPVVSKVIPARIPKGIRMVAIGTGPRLEQQMKPEPPAEERPRFRGPPD